MSNQEIENTKKMLETATNETLAEFIETDHYFDDYEMAAVHYRHQIAKRLRRADDLEKKLEERDADILAHSDKYQELAKEFDAQSEEIFRLKKTIGGNCPVTDTDQRCHIVDLLAEERDTAEKDLAAVRDAHELPPIPCGLVVNEYARKAGAWERVRTVLDEKGDK